MVSKELENAIRSYEDYINANGIDKDVTSAYVEAVKWAFYKDKDIETGLTLTQKAKSVLNSHIIKTAGDDIFALERHSQQYGEGYDELNWYYDILRMQAPYDVKAFFEYIEIDTEQAKRFYYPRKHTLSSILNAYQ